MTEIPEHLLARSKARRAGGAAPAGDSAPAKAAESSAAAAPKAEAAPAAAAAAAPKKKEEPKLPWVEAANTRRKLPVWAVSALALLPIWAVVYATTNDPQSPKQAGPLTIGAEKYSSCAGCHGATGGGGAGPALTNLTEDFPEPAEHLRWVILGTAGYQSEGSATYGVTDKTVGAMGNMPAQDKMDSTELLSIIRHERETLSGEEFDEEAWLAAVETLLNDPNPVVADKAASFGAIVETWATYPAGS